LAIRNPGNICGDHKSPLENAAMTEATATVSARAVLADEPFSQPECWSTAG
jgi:hypothetical protein